MSIHVFLVDTEHMPSELAAEIKAMIEGHLESHGVGNFTITHQPPAPQPVVTPGAIQTKGEHLDSGTPTNGKGK